MFDVGLSEIMLLLAIALVVLGPERLPRLARTVGAYVRKARAAWYQVKFEIDRELQASEMRETWQKSVGQAQRELAEVNQEVRSGLEQTQQAVSQINQDARQINAALQQDIQGEQASTQTPDQAQTSDETPAAAQEPRS